MTTTTASNSTAAQSLWLARFVGVGNVNRDNARGNGNRAARRAGWYVRPTAGPELQREIREMIASL